MDVKINEKYISEEFVQQYLSNYKCHCMFPECSCKIMNAYFYHAPFRAGVLPEFLSYTAEFRTDLMAELESLEFFDKNNDLYQFKQSNDLHSEDTPCISKLRRTLESEVRLWLMKLTGRELSPSIDIFCSKYSYTDYLLCHDDLMDKRFIAFNYYLNSQWSVEDGGSLDLYSVNENGQPEHIQKSILPTDNTLAVFEVSPVSFHQVSEVLSVDKTRLAVSGWFNCDSVTTSSKTFKEAPPTLLKCLSIEEDLFYKWVNPTYLNSSTQSLIVEKFEETSELELVNFLNVDMYNQLLDQLSSDKTTWKHLGPPNIRRCDILRDVGGRAAECLRVFQSDAMFLTLASLTGLNLYEPDKTPPNDSSEQSCSGRKFRKLDTESASDGACVSLVLDSAPSSSVSMGIFRWSHGSYTLVRGQGHESVGALDATLFIGCSLWDMDHGGYLSYIASDEDLELLSVNPSSNCLALVYRDSDAVKFVKRINHKILQNDIDRFYTLSAIYYE